MDEQEQQQPNTEPVVVPNTEWTFISSTLNEDSSDVLKLTRREMVKKMLDFFENPAHDQTDLLHWLSSPELEHAFLFSFDVVPIFVPSSLRSSDATLTTLGLSQVIDKLWNAYHRHLIRSNENPDTLTSVELLAERIKAEFSMVLTLFVDIDSLVAGDESYSSYNLWQSTLRTLKPREFAKNHKLTDTTIELVLLALIHLHIWSKNIGTAHVIVSWNYSDTITEQWKLWKKRAPSFSENPNHFVPRAVFAEKEKEEEEAKKSKQKKQQQSKSANQQQQKHHQQDDSQTIDQLRNALTQVLSPKMTRPRDFQSLQYAATMINPPKHTVVPSSFAPLNDTETPWELINRYRREERAKAVAIAMKK